MFVSCIFNFFPWISKYFESFGNFQINRVLFSFLKQIFEVNVLSSEKKGTSRDMCFIFALFPLVNSFFPTVIRIQPIRNSLNERHATLILPRKKIFAERYKSKFNSPSSNYNIMIQPGFSDFFRYAETSFSRSCRHW